MDKREFLVQEMQNIGIFLTDQQCELFEIFYADLTEKNRVMNLTAITEWEDVVRKHFVDSLAIIKICDLSGRKVKVIDVGTGAGFPGIPLSILYPDQEITMVDSVGKKIGFIQGEIEKLGIRNANAVHGRVEDLARQQEYREKFDICVSRAVANLSTLSEYCLPFVKINGSFLSYKSGNCLEELQSAKYAIRQLSGKIERTEKYLIHDSFSRMLIEIKKVDKTPLKYPRKAGIPAKSPLQPLQTSQI